MKRLIARPSTSVKAASFVSRNAEEATEEVYYAIRNLYNVMSKYEGNIEQILDDPSYYDATMDEVRYLESVLGIN